MLNQFNTLAHANSKRKDPFALLICANRYPRSSLRRGVWGENNACQRSDSITLVQEGVCD